MPLSYDRARDLPRLLPVLAEELADASLPGQRRLVALLERACRIERQRGLAGHWDYDLPRHRSLYDALAIERHRLAERERLRGALIASIELELAS